MVLCPTSKLWSSNKRVRCSKNTVMILPLMAIGILYIPSYYTNYNYDPKTQISMLHVNSQPLDRQIRSTLNCQMEKRSIWLDQTQSNPSHTQPPREAHVQLSPQEAHLIRSWPNLIARDIGFGGVSSIQVGVAAAAGSLGLSIDDGWGRSVHGALRRWLRVACDSCQ